MWSVTLPVDADMKPNVVASERFPRLMVAAAAGVTAVLVPGVVLKGLCLAGATALLATLATGYCPINEALDDGDQPQHSRTLKTFRIEP